MSGAIFDPTGDHRAASANGALWNAPNGAVVLFLLLRRRGGGRAGGTARPRPEAMPGA